MIAFFLLALAHPVESNSTLKFFVGLGPDQKAILNDGHQRKTEM